MIYTSDPKLALKCSFSSCDGERLNPEFTYLLDSLANGVVIADAAGTIVYSNRFLERMFGYEHGQLLGQSVEMLLPAEFRELHTRHRMNYTAAPETRLMGAGRDLLGRRKDGSVFPVEVGLSPMKTPEGMRIVAMVTDITRRKHAEQRSILQRDIALILAKAESIENVALNLLETIGSSLGWRLGALWLVDADSNALRNGAFWRAASVEVAEFEAVSRRLTFRKGECLLGHVWETGKPEWVSDLGAMEDFLRAKEAKTNGLHSVFELPILIGGETLGVIEFFAYELRPLDEDLVEIGVAVASQIGQFVERKRSERALGIFQERYRSLFENAVFGIIRSTASGEILDANPALVAMLGYDTVDEVLRLNCYKDVYKDPQDRERLSEHSRTADRFDGFEVEWRTKTGGTIQVRLSGRTVRGEARSASAREAQARQGAALREARSPKPRSASAAARSPKDRQVAGFEAIVENITQRKLLEQQYRQAQKMEAIGRLAGGVAHDFNNLLTIIAVSTDSLLEPNITGETLHHTADEIARATDQGASLVRQLMAFSRTQPQIMEPINLNEVIRSSQRMLEILAGEDIRFELGLHRGECVAAIEASRVEQILMNMVANSRDAMPRGGTVMISTAIVDVDEENTSLYVGLKPGKHVTLRVADTGLGIPAEVQPHIFEPFFTTKGGEGRGNGLGLSTVYGIVRQHEGHVSCESEPGQGATFTVFLPVAEPAARTPVQSQPASQVRRGNETVLLVEDESALRSSICRILEQNGYEVMVASNGVEALNVVEHQPNGIDLLVTDIALPQMRGTELAARLLRQYPQMRVLYMSGYSEERVPTNVGHFIPKPFRREALMRKIREVLDSTA
jgi:two-component system cell cycle sensor histidine kinase/response regulator CckA